MKTVMVTGVGAIIGYGVLRSLRAARPDLRLIGSDIYPDAVGQVWCDHFVNAPLTSDAAYPTWLHEQVTTNQVDLLIPAIEQDVDYLSDNRERAVQLGCPMVLNNRKLVETARDKWAMDQELVSMNEPSRIESLDRGTFEQLSAQLGLPFLLKPRRGYASKGIVRVTDQASYTAHATQLGNRLIAQRIVGSEDQEFTVSIFGDGMGAVLATSCLQRRLAADGSTSKAVSTEVAGVAEVVARLCEHFKPEGPTNLQFRKAEGEWKLLEINPRISSSTSIRTAFGYNESAMCVDYYLGGIIPTQPTTRRGYAARYIEEVIVHDRDHF